MIRQKKKSKVIILFIITLLLLTSCSKLSRKKELDFYHYDVRNKEVYEEVAKEYSKDSKYNINVKAIPKEEYMDTITKDKKLPDIFLIPEEDLENLLEDKKTSKELADLKRFAKKEELDDELFISLGIKKGKIRKKTLAIPYTYNIPTVFYNKDIFKRFNLKKPVNLADFLRLYNILYEEGINPLNINIKNNQWDLESLSDGVLVNSSTSHDLYDKENGLNIGFEDLYGFLSSIKDTTPLAKDSPSNKEALFKSFVNKESAMVVGTTSNIEFLDEEDLNYGFFTIPGSQGNKDSVVRVDSLISISKKSRSKKEAESFISYLLTDEIQERIVTKVRGYPISNSNTISDEELEEIYNLISADFLTPSLFQTIDSEKRHIYLENLNNIFLDKFLYVDIFLEDLENELKN